MIVNHGMETISHSIVTIMANSFQRTFLHLVQAIQALSNPSLPPPPPLHPAPSSTSTVPTPSPTPPAPLPTPPAASATSSTSPYSGVHYWQEG